MSQTTINTTINTDLLTPLGAYLRLRGAGRASFVLESVERGRLGRNSWIGAGSRLVSFDEADELGLPVVGYLAYDHAARLEPTVPLPPDGRSFPESRLVVAETLVRFDHGAGVAKVIAGDPDEIAGRLDAGIPWHRERRGAAGPLRRFPDQARYEEMVRTVKEHIVAGDVFQAVPSQRAERPTSASPLDVSFGRLGRPCDRAEAGAPVLARDEPLGRRADERDPVQLEQEQVRRRVDAAQGAVDVERRGGRGPLRSLRRHGLEDVSGDDVLLDGPHHLLSLIHI